jgi:hypothetical protein
MRGNVRARALLVVVMCALAATVWARLACRVPESVETPLVTYVSGMQPMPVELPGAPYLSTQGIVQVHRLHLVMDRPEDLLRHRALRLLVGTHQTFPNLVGAELRLVGTACRYVTASGARFPNNDVLTLTRSASCSAVHTVPSGALLLTVRFTGDARVAVWTYTQPAGVETNGAIRLKGPSTPAFPRQPSIRGSFIDEYRTSGVRVIDLLAHMWQLGPQSWYLNAVLLWAAASIIAAVCLCPLGALPHSVASAAAWRGAAAAGLLAFGLSLVFVVVIPPFQAPDEPNHFLGFMTLVDRQTERPNVDQWARTTHFSQLRFNGSERFRPIDSRQPQDTTWTDASPSDFDRRSSTTAAWRAVGWLTRNQPISVVFLTMRLTHALMLGFAFAAGGLIVIVGSGAPCRHLAFVPLLLAPTIPFFGMHISNHAFLTSAYVLMACGVLLVFLGGPKAHISGVLLGLGVATGAVAGRSSLPLLPLVGAAIAARILTPVTDGVSRARSAAIFWFGIALSLVGVHLLRAELPPERLAQVLASLPDALRPFAIVIEQPVACGIVICVAGALTDLLAGRRSGVGLSAGSIKGTVTRLLSYLAAGIVCLVLSASVLLHYPHVPPVQLQNRPPARDYLSAVMSTAATPRLRDPDMLLTTSFWGGFGWLDRLLPSWAIVAYTLVTAAALVGLLITIGRTRNVALFVRGSLILAGGAVSLAIYAVGTLHYSPDIHGRYLIGLYLSGLGVCGSAILLGPEGRALRMSESTRTSVLLVALATMYAAVFWFVIGQYF